MTNDELTIDMNQPEEQLAAQLSAFLPHAAKLANVTNDVTCWALYEAETAKSPSTSISSQSVAVRETPYSLDEYFQLYDNLAWSDEFTGTSLSAGSGKNWQWAIRAISPARWTSCASRRSCARRTGSRPRTTRCPTPHSSPSPSRTSASASTYSLGSPHERKRENAERI